MYAELANSIEKSMLVETARWGDVGGTLAYDAQWRTERDYLLNTYMVQRPPWSWARFRNAGLYPNVEAPVFQINGVYQHGGHAATGAKLSMTGGRDLVHPRRQRPASTAQATQADTSTTLVPENAPKRVLVPRSAVPTPGAAADASMTPPGPP